MQSSGARAGCHPALDPVHSCHFVFKGRNFLPLRDEAGLDHLGHGFQIPLPQRGTGMWDGSH
jgi:hypothetical protein